LHSKLLISRSHRGIINFPSENKYCRDDLILNLKKESNLSIREIAEILGINRGIVSRVKV
jgi:hypothetical protein